jgi:hypothetical protein
LLPYAGATGMRWPLENGQFPLGEKKGQSYRPPSLGGPASIARADRFLVRRGLGSRGVSDPCSAREDAPPELALPETTKQTAGGESARGEWSLHA